jgi:hypothetical protein
MGWRWDILLDESLLSMALSNRSGNTPAACASLVFTLDSGIASLA